MIFSVTVHSSANVLTVVMSVKIARNGENYAI